MDEVGLEPTMPVAEDLQSSGVTNFPTHPYNLVPRWRIELPYPPCKDGVLPLNYRGLILSQITISFSYFFISTSLTFATKILCLSMAVRAK